MPSISESTGSYATARCSAICAGVHFFSAGGLSQSAAETERIAATQVATAVSYTHLTLPTNREV